MNAKDINKINIMKNSDFDLINQNQNIESKIIASLERISQAFKVLLWHESIKHSLTPIQIQILVFLLNHSEEKRNVSYLSKEFNLTKATISDTIKALTQKHLIKKTSLLKDNRSFVIHLTNRGLKIAQKISLFTHQLKIPIQKLNKNNKENLLLSLIDIIRHLNEAGIITIQRMCFTCQYYKSSKINQTHFCILLNKKLLDKDLRIDCPEHLYIIDNITSQ